MKEISKETRLFFSIFHLHGIMYKLSLWGKWNNRNWSMWSSSSLRFVSDCQSKIQLKSGRTYWFARSAVQSLLTGFISRDEPQKLPEFSCGKIGLSFSPEILLAAKWMQLPYLQPAGPPGSYMLRCSQGFAGNAC